MPARALLSAVLAALPLAADIALLALYLNPEVALRREAVALTLTLFLPYELAAALALAALAFLGAAVRGWPRAPRPPIDGLPWFTTLSAFSLAAAAALFWLNLLTYRYAIPVEFVRGLAASAVVVTAAVFVLVVVGVDALLFPLRNRGISAAVVVLACASAVVLPLAMKPIVKPQPRPLPFATETVQPARRVILVGIDGLGPEELEDGIARGNLPALDRIRRRGAWGPLATLRPTEGPPVWTTLMTGRLPRDHGIKSFVTYRLRGSATSYELLPRGTFVGALDRVGLVTTAPVTSTARRRRALWNALNAFGIHTGLVRVWGTYPIEKVQGFMLSHYFHLLRHDPARVASTLYPPDLLAEVQARAVDAGDVDRDLLSQFLDVPRDGAGDGVPWRRDLLERGLAPDLTYERAGSVLRAAYDPPFYATYFYGLDAVGHTFTRYAQPERFGDVRPEEVRRYGRVVSRYEAYLSHVVGEYLRGLRPGEILVVVSGYGMEPVPLWRRVLSALGGGPASGTHAGAPDGVVLAVGDGIRPGSAIRNASILDVAPTILYLMGLPVARDMEGRVFTEMLDEDFTRAHPVSVIPSYESLAVTPVAPGAGDLPPMPEEGP